MAARPDFASWLRRPGPTMPLFRELTDLDNLRDLMGAFYRAFGVPHSISNSDGAWLIAKGWEDACTRFFRVHPESCASCHKSDARIVGMRVPNRHVCDRCDNGLEPVG